MLQLVTYVLRAVQCWVASSCLQHHMLLPALALPPHRVLCQAAAAASSVTSTQCTTSIAPRTPSQPPNNQLWHHHLVNDLKTLCSSVLASYPSTASPRVVPGCCSSQQHHLHAVHRQHGAASTQPAPTCQLHEYIIQQRREAHCDP